MMYVEHVFLLQSTCTRVRDVRVYHRIRDTIIAISIIENTFLNTILVSSIYHTRVSIIAFKVGLHQLQITTQSPQVFNIQVDTGAKLVNPLASKKRWKIQNGLLTTSSGSTNTSFGSNSQDQNNVFRLPNGLKIRLCRALDQPPNATLNDWRALAAALITKASVGMSLKVLAI